MRQAFVLSDPSQPIVRHPAYHIHLYGLLLLLISVACFPHAIVAQTLQGLVRELGTQTPVPRAEVVFLRLSGQGADTVALARADENGRFAITAPTPGAYGVYFRRIGFLPGQAGNISFAAGDTLTAVFDLTRLPTTLEPIVSEVEAYVRYLDEEGFYRRERVGDGQHFDPLWVERRRDGSVRVHDLLLHAPGLTLASHSAPGEPPILRAPRCPSFGYFIDGLPLPLGARLDDFVLVEDVLAVEIYRSAPVQFVRAGQPCAVVIWTRFKAERRANGRR